MAPGILSRLLGRFVPAVVLVVAVSGVVWSARDGSASASFAPSFEVALADDSPGAASDVTFGFDIGAPDANFRQLVSFAPPEFEFSPDDEVTTGAFAGTVNAQATLGLVNGACNSDIDVVFEMYEASTDITQTIPLYSGLEDFDNDGLVENIERYPTFLANIAPNLKPVQRLYGQLLISGLLTPLNFVMFEPGAPLPLHPALDPSLGYPIVITLLDPTAPIENSSISDFCTPLSTTTEMFGVSRDNPNTAANEAGEVLHRNPSDDGEYVWTMFARSRWDADDDGIENALDPCPYDANEDWDPRANVSAQDPDGDGLPSACDFAPNDYNSDQDGDGFLNRLDLCPRVVNVVSGIYMYDADNDAVGDACDRDPNDASDGGLSVRQQLCVSATSTVGAGGADPVVPPCPEGPDLVVPASFTLYPPEWQTGAGNVQSMYISVVRPLGAGPVPGVTVEFEVTGANLATDECMTDNYGSCQFNYVGLNVGMDVVEASAIVDDIALTATATIEWVVPPSNDDFANAIEIAGLPFEDEKPPTGGSVEDGEPMACGPLDQTVWYRFTPQEDVFVVIEGSRALEWVTLGLYRGESISELQPLVCGYPWYSGQGEPGGETVPSGYPPKTYVYALLDAGEAYSMQVGTAAYTPGGDLILKVTEGAPGDANCDGKSDTTDALAVLQWLAYGYGGPCLAGGDVNCDGAIETIDALEILRRIAGLSLKVGCG